MVQILLREEFSNVCVEWSRKYIDWPWYSAVSSLLCGSFEINC